MWGDPDDLPLCECCCSEHTFSSCPARAIGTCRGQNTLTTQDLEGWAKYYGMELSEFLCYEPPVPPDYTAPAPEPRSFDDIWDEVQENYEYKDSVSGLFKTKGKCVTGQEGSLEDQQAAIAKVEAAMDKIIHDAALEAVKP